MPARIGHRPDSESDRGLRSGLCLLAGILSIALTAAQATAERFRVEGDVLIFDTETGDAAGEIVRADVQALVDALRANPNVTTLHLNSGGGLIYPAFDMANVVIDFELDTHVDGTCESSCTYIFLGGENRSMARGARIGFHQNNWRAANIQSFYEDNKDAYGWADPFEFASWLYEDTQQETYNELRYLIRRGVAADFALETIRNRSSRMWYPYRGTLTAAGVLTSISPGGARTSSRQP